MWICFNNAFVSAVQDEQNPDLLRVRARRKIHLVRLFGKDANIITTNDTDYRYRVFVSKREFATLVMVRIIGIDYPNFKDSTKDPVLHDLYNAFWGLHWGMQQTEGLGQKPPKIGKRQRRIP